MSVEFDTPANRIIEQLKPKQQFEIQLLPDIAFLRQLSIQGRLRYFQGTGGLLTITPSIGDTLFFYKITLSGSDSATDATVTVANDGNTREISIVKGASNTITILGLTMDSLVGDSIKSFTVTSTQGEIQVSVFAWVENTSRIRDVTT